MIKEGGDGTILSLEEVGEEEEGLKLIRGVQLDYTA
jgi:hypothetical protein